MVSPENKKGNETMKQVFYSEHLDKYFDTEKECQDAEAKYAEAMEAKSRALAAAKEKEEARKNELSKEKKVLADAVDEADKAVSTAYSNLEVVYAEANDILREAKQKANKLVDEAKTQLKNAQQKKFEAVSKFNEKFGTYTTTYTGDRALEELRRATSWVNDIFNNFFF